MMGLEDKDKKFSVEGVNVSGQSVGKNVTKTVLFSFSKICKF